MATKLEGEGGKALVAGPIKKELFAASLISLPQKTMYMLQLAPDMAKVADDLWSCYNLPRYTLHLY